MQYTTLGRTALQVSKLCLGTMNFGPQTTEPDSFKIMDEALDHGINFFDTADVYGWSKGEGITEQIVGRWFAQGGGRREKVVIATKFYGDMGDWPNTSRASALYIRRACEASLKRLQTDYLDLYQMHHVWREAPWEEVWEAMEILVRSGKVIYTGSSNYGGWHIAKANEAARRRHFLGLVSEQCKYSLNARMVEMEVLPACQDYGLGVLPWSPLGSGLLGGILAKAKEGRRSQEWVQKAVDENRAALEKWEGFCADFGRAPADMALAWLRHQPAVTAPIIGPRTSQQLAENVGSLDITLSDEDLAKIDEIWPGYKTSPEHFAW